MTRIKGSETIFLAVSVVSAKSNISNVFQSLKRGNLKHSMQANDNLWTDNDSAETDRYEDWLQQGDFEYFENPLMAEVSL